ncbi:hypothetical protein D9619_006533 [Psilocybe cf. subviscida]|uniref:SET domain-containing protein n=1 Tax=Psilocybe cf. subviscida TaxID=2480587 RepID=A0A8H5B640_9AGAR|nr:hypothetical protein D9619_006533 [Psilocybe cf. subviscida]
MPHLDTSKPPLFEFWLSEGMDGAQGISSALSSSLLAKSSDAINMEDLYVVSLWASREIEGRHAFVPQILGDTFNHSGEVLRDLRRLVKDRKKDANPSDSMKHISILVELINTLKSMEHFTHLGDAQLAVLRWCICAYTMATHPTSPVDVRVNAQKKFVLLATAPIQAGQVVYEAIGMMPGDDEVVSKFASITVSPEQNQEAGAKRTLYGPLRMARHRCQNYNAEFMPLKGTSAFVLRAKFEIPAGEEITCDYGARNEDCICRD